MVASVGSRSLAIEMTNAGTSAVWLLLTRLGSGGVIRYSVDPTRVMQMLVQEPEVRFRGVDTALLVEKAVTPDIAFSRPLETRSGWLVCLATEPWFDGLRGESRFEEMVETVGLLRGSGVRSH